MDPLTILWPPAFVLAEGAFLLAVILIVDRWITAKGAATVATVNYDLVAPTPDDLPDFDNGQCYCPACLARWHEYHPDLVGVVPAGDAAMCEDHARRLSVTLDPRAIARGSVAWLLYGMRPQQTEEAE